MNFRTLTLTALAASSLALSACANAPGYGPGYGSAPPPVSGTCYDCGTVTRIDMVGGTSTAPSATGAVIGGVVGAVAGRELAKENTDSQSSRNIATVAGAAAGAAVGNAIQNRTAGGSYNVYVRMNDGRETVVTQSDISGIRQGSYVRVYNGRAWVR